jgi:hypothetical protein
MMKKVVLLVLALLVTAVPAAFAEFRLGPTALYNLAVIHDGFGGPLPVTLSDFTFGGEARLDFWLFQLGAMALYSPPWREAEFADEGVLELLVSGGISFRLLFLRLSGTIGPSIVLPLGETDPAVVGSNARLAADIVLGRLSLSIFYLLEFEFPFYDFHSLFDAELDRGNFGVSVLFSF